jgi:hypothetical protein
MYSLDGIRDYLPVQADDQCTNRHPAPPCHLYTPSFLRMAACTNDCNCTHLHSVPNTHTHTHHPGKNCSKTRSRGSRKALAQHTHTQKPCQNVYTHIHMYTELYTLLTFSQPKLNKFLTLNVISTSISNYSICHTIR